MPHWKRLLEGNENASLVINHGAVWVVALLRNGRGYHIEGTGETVAEALEDLDYMIAFLRVTSDLFRYSIRGGKVVWPPELRIPADEVGAEVLT